MHVRLENLRLCAVESRPIVQLVFALRFVVGALCARSVAAMVTLDLYIGLSAWVCAVMAIYVLNGIMDVAEDRVNGSRRPIARGALSLEFAGRATWCLAALALLLGSLVPQILWQIGGFLILGYVYSAPRFAAKRQSISCSLVITGLGMLTYLAGAGVVAEGLSARSLVFGFFMSLWMGLVGAITKDFDDVRGDRSVGRRTLAVVRGEAFARVFTAVAASAIGIGYALFAAFYDPLVLVGGVPLLVGSGWVAWSCLRPSANDTRSPYRAFMCTQYVVHICMFAALVSQ